MRPSKVELRSASGRRGQRSAELALRRSLQASEPLAPYGGCGHDSECPADRYCRAADLSCALDLANGNAVPEGHGECGGSGNDGLHTGCSEGMSRACSTGLCSSDSGLCVASNNVTCDRDAACASSICGSNGKCGLADGEGPCSEDDAARSCQSGKCSPHDNACITGACWVGADCGRGEDCDRAAQSCASQLKPGATLPKDDLHERCEASGRPAHRVAARTAAARSPRTRSVWQAEVIAARPAQHGTAAQA